MSNTPNNIFSRLEVLKKWQEEQQERLLKQQTEENSLTERLSNALDEKPIEDTPISSKCVDDVELPEPKDFNELLDEKLKMIEDVTVVAKPKRPFLRKGAGLVRFHMSNDSPKPVQRSTPKQKPAELSEKPTWRNVLTKSVDEPSYEQQAFEKQLEKDLFKKDVDELRIFEILEKKASSNSFCSTSSVVMRMLEMTSPKRVVSIPPTPEYRDESAWSESESESSTLSESSVSDSVQPIYNDAATNTDPVSPPGNSEVLRSRLEQLEKEIETFRQENAKIKKNKTSFDKEKNKLETEIEEQRKQLDNEKKRLAREKHVNEKYLREMRTGGTRKERDEITALKNQLAAVKEELKQKESRYGASQARQRNQIRSLEKEIAALKAENDELRKQNGKLQTQLKVENRRSQPPSDTKVLHEINRNLSLLTKQQRLQTDHSQSEKENDPSDPSFVSITKDYEKAFGKHKPDKKIPSRMDTRASSESSECLLEKSKPKASADRVERLLPDGTKEITYANGNVKTIRNNKVTMRYYNGDIKETNAETATVRYFYAEANIWHTTYAEDGLEVIEFPDGQVEKRRRDGSTEVSFPDGCVRCTTPGGTETIDFPDGTVVVRKPNGDKVLTLPNGQKEVHTEEHMRREYPDGTVKLLYPDGTQETRYANGRIRLKDSSGVLIMDTADD